MSIAVAVSATEGMAVATDSRTVELRVGAGPEYHVSSDTAEKIFVVEERFCVATYGIAMIGGQTIRDLMKRLHASRGTDVNEFASTLADFFCQQLRDATPAPRKELPKTIDPSWPLGFAIAGYDREGLGTVVDVKVRPTAAKTEVSGLTTESPGLIVRGHGDAVRRMIDGVDWQAVKEQGIKLDAGSREQLEELRYDLTDSPTLDEAALRAAFYVEAQIKMQDFSDGTFAKPRTIPACGGPIRVVSVAPDRAAWVQNPGQPVVSVRQNADVLAHAGEAG